MTSTLLVDLSNVCRDAALGGATGLARYDRLIASWRTQIDADAVPFPVADDSLLSRLPAADRERLRREAAEGQALIARYADEALLALAERRPGCRVLSRDRYVGARRRHAWIERHPRRFFTWTVEAREIRIRMASPRRVPIFDVSRSEQREVLIKLGFSHLSGNPERDPALALRWRCVSNEPCATREFDPRELRTWPLRDGDLIVCPGCRTALAPAGDRELAVELKVLVGNDEIDRFTLADGEALVIGRETIPAGSALAALVESGALVGLSRRHAELTVAGKRLALRDLGSSNGTYLRRWNGVARRHRERIRLARNQEQEVGPRDRVELGKALAIVRSGKPFAEAARFDDGPAPAAADAPTHRHR